MHGHLRFRGLQAVLGPGVIIRGDLGKISIGKCSFIGEGSSLLPNGASPLLVGAYTTVGRACVVEAARIGSCVRIGDGCRLVSSSLPALADHGSCACCLLALHPPPLTAGAACGCTRSAPRAFAGIARANERRERCLVAPQPAYAVPHQMQRYREWGCAASTRPSP